MFHALSTLCFPFANASSIDAAAARGAAADVFQFIIHDACDVELLIDQKYFPLTPPLAV